MKVILLEDLNGVGKKFDIKEVKGGYARNFLIPKKLAQTATDSAVKNLERQKIGWEKKEKETIEKIKAAAEKLKGLKLEFNLKTGEKGEVFGSVTKKEIEEAIAEKTNSSIEYIRSISPAGPLKTLGEHEIEIDLGKDIKATITVFVYPAIAG